MRNIPNGGRPIRFIRLGTPIVQQPQVVLAPATESFQEVTIPEIPADNK